MAPRLTFLGAARNVTGSCHMVEADGCRILVDCGFYQERDFKSRNWDPFPVPPESIDAVLLTHAHLDHCGRIPKLVKEGFKGKVFATAATAEIAGIVMLDAAHIQEEDVKYKLKRHKKQNKKSPFPYEPLFTKEDAEKTITLFEKAEYNTPIKIGDGMEAVFREAGHILGSSNITVKAGQGEERRSILFSGDIGRVGTPILEDPADIEEADYILVESTYGNREHKGEDTITQALADIVNEGIKTGGKIMIPSFAIERSQELLYRLNHLLKTGQIPHVKVYLDSPMAIRVTEVFRHHAELFDSEAVQRMHSEGNPFDFPDLEMTMSVNQSKKIARHKGAAIIIAGSGMCTGGRIKHHLKANISDENSIVLFVGYQARGTLGRLILEGKKEIRLHGEYHQVKARIERINGFSAHADKNELYDWLKTFTSKPKQLFIVHGEAEAAESFASWLKERTDWNISVPDYQDSVELS